MIPIRQREVYRYMGFRNGAEPDERIRQRVAELEEQLQKAVSPKSVYRKFPLIRHEDGGMEAAGIDLTSKSLERNLKGCSEVYLFAATIGIGADRLIARAQIERMSDAVILQAASAEMIESYCNRINKELKQKEAENGNFLRPRFSPGYGDLPLELQPDFIRVLEAPKKIGLTLTDTLLMVPSKSVTAIIGISRTDSACVIQGCESCGKTDCEFRRT